MDSADQEDSINRIKFTEETVFGAPIEMQNLNKVQGIIIRLRKNENVEKSKNILIAMLEELLKKEAVADKKKILSEEYGIVMRDDTERRLNTMCNLSEVVLEKGIEQGIEKGIEKGMRQLIQQMRNNGKNTKEIAEFCGIPMERVEEMYNTINEI